MNLWNAMSSRKKKTTIGVALSKRRRGVNVFKRVTLLLFTLAFWLRVSSAFAVDEVEFFCNGSSGTTCDVFQLDGGNTATGVANTCVGTENGCSNENPKWPADWDALLYPSLTNPNSTGTFTPIAGGNPGAARFTLPWGGFGSFSGIITSTLVSNGTSTILKQGTKNTDDLSLWTVASQSSPPKDAYLAGALATYVGPRNTSYAGEELLYFGSTRFSPNGSATVGIWFFQENVFVCPSGTAMCTKDTNGNTVPAQHKKNDLFLFLTYSGSGNATIQAATWQGGDGTTGSLGSATTLVVCPTPGDEACAVTNELSSIILGKSSTAFQAPGTGFNVSGPGFAGFPGGVVPALQFQEGGVDLNDIFNGTPPCFNSVLFASVASGSSPNTASMKSILLGSFNTCAISATKVCSDPTVNADNTLTYPISGTVTNVGSGSVQTLSLTDTFNNSPQAFDSGSLSCTCVSNCTISGSTCSSVQLNTGGSVTYNATITTTSNGGSDVVTATISGAATAQSNTAQCPIKRFPPSITITKTCDPGASLVAQSGLVAVKVGVGGTVRNGSSNNLTLSNVREFECINGTFAVLSNDAYGCPVVPASYENTCSGTLKTVTNPTTSSLSANGASAWSDSYFPSVAPACGPYNFNDQVLVEADCTSQFCKCQTVVNVASAICPLCPGPTCP